MSRISLEIPDYGDEFPHDSSKMSKTVQDMERFSLILF